MNAASMIVAKRSVRMAGPWSDRAVQDCAFAALIVLSRIPANLGTAGAAFGLMLICIYAVLRVDRWQEILRRCRVQLAYPALTLMSVVWAIYPAVTLRAGIQMSVTAFAGLLLSQSVRPRVVLLGLFAVFAGYTLASLIAGHSQPDGIAGIPALVGLGGEAKNYFADSASTASLLALAVAALCLEKRAFTSAGLCAIVAFSCLLATERARSAGAVASLALAAVLLLALLALRQRSPTVKGVFTIVFLAALGLCAIFFQPLLAMVTELSDKDAGLTGRGYLWYRAQYIIAERPWLGTGYFGFWTPANPDAIGLWRYFGVRQEGTAFSFHNSYIQTMVETGYIGLGVLLATWVCGIAALLRRFVLTPSLPTCFWLSYLVLELSKSPVEPIRPAALVAPTIMLFIALGFGCFPVLKRPCSG